MSSEIEQPGAVIGAEPTNVPAEVAEAKHSPIDLNEPVIRAILRIGLPSMVGFGVFNLYSVADMYWVSELGGGAVAAITIFSAFLWVVTSVNMIAGSGSVAIISRRYGEGDFIGAGRAILEAIILKWILGIAAGGIAIIFVPNIMSTLGATGETLDMAVAYGRINLAGLAINFSCWTVYTALRGIDRARLAMVLMVSSAALNAILDPIFIRGYLGVPAFGVPGAAIASILSFVVTFIVGIAVLTHRSSPAPVTRRTWHHLSLRTMWQMIKIGIPVGLNSVSFSLGRMIVMGLVATFGEATVAIYGAGNRMIETAIMIVVGLELGTSTYVGHCLGAKDKARAWRTGQTGILLGSSSLAVIGLIGAILAEPLMRIFFDGEPYISQGVTFLRIAACALPLIGGIMMVESVFGGSGNTVPPMVIVSLATWVLEVPIIWLVVKELDMAESAVWWAIVIVHAVEVVAMYAWYSRKKWLDREV